MYGGNILQNISYIYDPEGNITEIEDTAQQTIYFNGSVVEPKSTYEYDALYRLIKATGREHNSLANLSENDFVNNIIRPEDGQNMRNFTQEYQYDEIGNLLQMKSNGVWTRDYQYNFNINSGDNNYLFNHDHNSTNAAYLYDAHGNMTKMPHLQEMKYDYADQLNEVTLDASGNKAYYVYDANGERVRKVVVKNTGTIVEDRFYVGDYEIYTKKTNGSLDTERETLHIIDDKSKVALIDYDTQNLTTTIRYQYTNHLDSASLELDETGDIISYEEYHPFGTTSYRSGRSEIDVSLKRYKYVHKELDNETGLYYYGMRYYAPWIAKFISVDPLQFDYPYYTPFQYAGNKPISYIDLDGAEPIKGEKNWGRNVFFGNDYSVKAIMPSERDVTNKNWIAFRYYTLEDANSRIKKIKKNNVNVNTVYLQLHGISFGGINAANNQNKQTDLPNVNKGGEPILSSDIRNYIKYSEKLNSKWGFIRKNARDILFEGKEFYNEATGTQHKISKNTGKAIRELIDISSEIENGGTLILGGCYVGGSDEFLSLLAELTGNRINIVANTNATGSGVSIREEGSSEFKYEILDLNLTEQFYDEEGWKFFEAGKEKPYSTKLDLILNRIGDPYSFVKPGSHEYEER